jgi:hypothetical protein
VERSTDLDKIETPGYSTTGSKGENDTCQALLVHHFLLIYFIL